LTYEVHELGEDSFRIFQDTRDIRVGQQWKTRVEDTINSATILIALLTPGFFRSEYCRRETEQFVERERKLGRNDLLFPLYYLSVRELEEAIAKKGAESSPDHLIEMIKREVSDWRHLRFTPLDSTEMSLAINRLAVEEGEQGLIRRFPSTWPADTGLMQAILPSRSSRTYWIRASR
jgi:TIR domain-containing protein